MGALFELFEHTSEAVFGIDDNRNIRFWNKSCESLLGLSHQQAIGKSCAELLCGKDLQGHNICTTECPIAKVHNVQACDSSFRIALENGDNKPINVTVGSYYINNSYQKNNDGIKAFHSMKAIANKQLHRETKIKGAGTLIT